MKNIVLDCDGVILDYNHIWGQVLSQFLQKNVLPKKIAYHAYNMFDYKLSAQETDAFHELFHKNGWINMQALEGALEAVSLLKAKHFEIHIVTSIPQEAYWARKTNLENLGFSFNSLHTVGFHRHFNPKKEIINQICPDFFVDDLMKNFEGINFKTDCILIDIPGEDNPNHLYQNKDSLNILSTHNSLLDFVKLL